MLVLQDCPICYASFDDEGMKPHTIPCGHIFCDSCLKELLPLRNKCPICRRAFYLSDIRSVVGMARPGQLESKSIGDSNEEMLLWQSLKDAIKAGPGSRKLLASNHKTKFLQGSELSQEIGAALDLLQIVVSTEEEELQLKERMKAVVDKADTLLKRISHLEEEIHALRTKVGHNSNSQIQSMSKLTSMRANRGLQSGTFVVPVSASLTRVAGIPVTSTYGPRRTGGSLPTEATRLRSEHQNGPTRGAGLPIELVPRRMRELNRLQLERRGLDQNSRGNAVRAGTAAAAPGRRACEACLNRATTRGSTARPVIS
ncbi:hypothetical protein OPQ81_011845 [Rhizoctonia solani]|nr:hypothetical protein OPQ81_011845 [Rhizoctonia solani]